MRKQAGKNNFILIFFMFLIICLVAFFLINGDTIKETFTSIQSSSNKNKSNIKIEYYYTKECGFCNKFNESGVWEELEKKKMNNVSLHKYDLNNNNERATKFNITSVPTIIAVDSSDKIVGTFEEERTLEKILNFINKYEKS